MAEYKRVQVPGWEGRYEIDTEGVVWSSIYKRPLRASIDRGYKRVMLCRDNKCTHAAVHRIVAETFIPNPNPYILTQVNHIDGVKTNNCVDNLEWVTPKKNLQEAVRIGLIPSLVRICTMCGKEFKRHRPYIHPVNYCDSCKQLYRDNNMAKSEKNLLRQKRILDLLSERGFTKSDIANATGKSMRSVSAWMNHQSNYKPQVLDMIERNLLGVK